MDGGLKLGKTEAEEHEKEDEDEHQLLARQNTKDLIVPVASMGDMVA